MICYFCWKKLSATSHYHLHPECFKKLFDVDTLDDFVEFARLSTGLPGSLDDGRDSSRDSQFHGHYPKYTAQLGGKRYILKFGKLSSYPILAETEALSNAIADSMGLPIAKPFGLIEYKEKKCFVVRDFLDTQTRKNLVHLWDIWPEKGQQKLPFHLSTLLEVLGKQVSYKEVTMCIELILFDYLIGNGDRHRGNIGFLNGSRGTKKLAPFYDNVSDLGLEDPTLLDPKMKWHPSTKVELEDRRTEIVAYLEQIKSLGFCEPITRFQKRLTSRSKNTLAIIAQFPADENLKACLADLWQRRSQEILQWS